MGPLVPEAGGGGVEEGGSRGTCPQAGRSGAGIEDRGEDNGRGLLLSSQGAILLSRIGIPQGLQVSFQF